MDIQTQGGAITVTATGPATNIDVHIQPKGGGKIYLEGPIVGVGAGAAAGVTLASAAALTIPVGYGRGMHISGTTSVTSIVATNVPADTVITLIFDGILTFTDGNNLKLAGDMTTSADDAITLYYDGFNFYELSRSAN